MDQKIRGITVTINGDTTGLGKALDTVKKQSIGLNRELKSVNKALNFNPSSASLLTEKQKVLTDSVRAAREELKTLEAAQANVEKCMLPAISTGAHTLNSNGSWKPPARMWSGCRISWLSSAEPPGKSCSRQEKKFPSLAAR